jgi:hypothetical protein
VVSAGATVPTVTGESADVARADVATGQVVPPEPRLGLAETIDLVRKELQRAADLGARERLAFRPESVEIELDVVFERSTGQDAGLRVWVLSAGAKVASSKARTERLKVTLAPVERSSGRTPEISDGGPE